MLTRRRTLALAAGLAAGGGSVAQAAGPRAVRLGKGPIITPQTHPSIGTNIAEPSLIRVPSWAKGALGRYYLYFADHVGQYIRMAYADRLEGPWRVHPPGVLRIEQTPFPTNLKGGHIASPDVHVDHERRRFVMYFHGLERLPNEQVTRVATSPDGLAFASAGPEILGLTYWRAFPFRGMTYAMAMPGQFYRSKDPLSGFETGPRLFNMNMRHGTVVVRGDQLKVAWTQVGDAPERIYLTTIDASGPWERWTQSAPVEILRPEFDWEGAQLPAEPSVRGAIERPVNQLRDPFFFEERGRLYMVYGIAGERGLALAEVFL